MRLKLFFAILAIIPVNALFAKNRLNNVFIEGTMNSKEFKEVIIRKLGVLKDDKTREFRIPIVNHTFKGSFYIPAVGFYNIGDGWDGHTIFIQPGDSIAFKLSIKPNLQATLKKTYSPNFHILSTKNKLWGNLLFFDKLTEQKKKIITKYNSSDPKGPTPSAYKQMCNKARMNAFLLLNTYKTKDSITDEFYKSAVTEINCKYILWLCDILSEIPKDKIPDNYFESISNVNFKDYEALYINGSFVEAAAVYNIYYLNLNSFNYKNWYSNLREEYTTAFNFFDGLLRDKVLAELIVEYSDKNYIDFNAVYWKFKTDCNNEVIKRNTIEIVEKNASKGKYDIKKLPSVLSTATIKNIAGEQFTLADVFSGKKYIIVDCWATWCIPCVKQKPYLQAFEKKYKDSVYFVYLSADEDSVRWKKYLKNKKTRTDNQFILANSFKSVFATFFEINTIPRYIFLKNDAQNIISPAMPIPTSKEAFEAVVKDAIQ